MFRSKSVNIRHLACKPCNEDEGGQNRALKSSSLANGKMARAPRRSINTATGLNHRNDGSGIQYATAMHARSIARQKQASPGKTMSCWYADGTQRATSNTFLVAMTSMAPPSAHYRQSREGSFPWVALLVLYFPWAYSHVESLRPTHRIVSCLP
jgi:hypothetical protein